MLVKVNVSTSMFYVSFKHVWPVNKIVKGASL
jgi:hypothetical protein